MSTCLTWLVYLILSALALDWVLRICDHCNRDQEDGKHGMEGEGDSKDGHAVKTNSRAAANAFKMEFSFLRNKLVMMPRIALLKIRRITKVWLMDANEDEEKALARSP